MIKTLLPQTAKNPILKQYRAVGLAMFLLAAGLLLSRIIATSFGAYLIQLGLSNNSTDIITTILFTILAQIVMCFLVVFLVYKITLKLNTKQIFAFSNFKKTHYSNFLIVIPIALASMFVTMGISSVWSIFLSTIGYVRSTSSISNLPDTFSPALFILQLFLIAVLPAVFEEFAMRGALLTVLREKYKPLTFYLLMALAFGLFHQNITQLIYTAFFGAIMAFVVTKTKSIYPAMLIHFINNGASVFLMHANAYNWPLGNLWNTLFTFAALNPIAAIISYLAIAFTLALLLILLHYINKKPTSTTVNKGAAPLSTPNPTKTTALKNNTFFIAAITITATFTLFSLIWGLL